jgi:hypothetical protein
MLGTATPAAAQSMGFGGQYQNYVFDQPNLAGVESISLFAIPVAASVSVGSRVSVSVSAAYAEATATGPDGLDSKLAGFSDTDLGVSLRVGPRWLLVSAGTTLPTGQATLTTREIYVASFFAADLLPFAINTWGTGGSVGGDVAVATQAGAWGIGFSAGYRLAQEYEPIPEFDFQYKPGNALQLRVALDRNVSTSGTLSILLGLQSFGDDEVEGANLFRSGTRIQGVVTYAFALGMRSSALVYGGMNHRSSGTAQLLEAVLPGVSDSPAQQLFMGGTNFRLAFGRGHAILSRAELLVYRAEDGRSQGWVGTLGPSFDWRITGTSASRQLVLVPSAYLRTGNVIVEDGLETGFLGWEAGLTLRWVPGR